MGTIWELDFYSRPLLDEQGKKRWELLICESPLDIHRQPASLFRFSKFCANTSVNSIWLQDALAEAIAQAPAPPQKIRFFRRQMNNMILKACQEMDLPAAPSRRTHMLIQWLGERMREVYPQEPNYDEAAANSASVKYPAMTAITLPDAIKGDKADKWTFVTLTAQDFEEMDEWEIGFSEAFSLAAVDITSQTPIPGFLIYSPRANPLAAWLSGLELGFLQYENGNRPRLRLETGVSDSWILANMTDRRTQTEAEKFEATKTQAQGIHFLAIQSDPASEAFAGFWLLKEINFAN